MELLHESNPEIKIDGKMYFFQCKPAISAEPVLIPDTFTDGTGVNIYGSVLYDGGHYRMWYQALPRDWNGADVSLVGYAESDNGLDWKKPVLKIVDYGGKSNNLCNLGFHSPSVFIDPEASPDRRYRATGYAEPGRVGSAEVQRSGYFCSYSGDGLNWSLESTNPQWEGRDVITSIFHPGRRRALVAMKQNLIVGSKRRRTIWQAELAGEERSEKSCALVPDEYDDVCALRGGYAGGDYYGMGMMPAGIGTVGFIWQFRHSLPMSSHAHSGVFGAVDITLAYQRRSSARWLHVFGRSDFISHESIAWGSQCLYTSSCPVAAGDEQRLYFSSVPQSHGWYLDSKWQLLEKYREELTDAGMASIGYASWPRYRLFGFRSDPEGILALDLGRIERPFELVLNYKAGPRGGLRVEIEGKSAYSAEHCLPLCGDELQAVVAWKSGTRILPEDGKNLSLKIYLQSSEIYAYDLKYLD